jgi:hypothetical protein
VDDPSTPNFDESTAGTGTFYFPRPRTYLLGTGDQFIRGLVADKIEVQGDGHKVVTGATKGIAEQTKCGSPNDPHGRVTRPRGRRARLYL